MKKKRASKQEELDNRPTSELTANELLAKLRRKYGLPTSEEAIAQAMQGSRKRIFGAKDDDTNH